MLISDCNGRKVYSMTPIESMTSEVQRPDVFISDHIMKGNVTSIESTLSKCNDIVKEEV